MKFDRPRTTNSAWEYIQLVGQFFCLITLMCDLPLFILHCEVIVAYLFGTRNLLG